MNHEPLPPGLRDLEDRLARRPCPEPAADLRNHILNAMSAMPARPSPGRRWDLFWRAAAAIFVALNLALSVDNGIRFQRLQLPATAPQDVGTRAAPRDPSASESEQRLDAFAASALATLPPAPAAGAIHRDFFTQREAHKWDLP